MSVWWENAPAEERAALIAVPSIAGRLDAHERANVLARYELTRPLREALLETLFASGADLLILPIQDVFGWRDRINQPATVGDSNWTWRMPWPVEEMSSEPAAIAVARRLMEWASRYGRQLKSSE
jgi:4-alpha-glucanotransferase